MLFFMQLGNKNKTINKKMYQTRVILKRQILPQSRNSVVNPAMTEDGISGLTPATSGTVATVTGESMVVKVVIFLMCGCICL